MVAKINTVDREVWVSPDYPYTGSPAAKPEKDIKWLIAHWPGGNVRPSTVDGMKLLMRAMQRDYKSNRGYNLGYCWALDPWGSFWESRGFEYNNAANDGTTAMKNQYGNINNITRSVLIICNLDEGANPVQQEALQQFQGVYLDRTGRMIPWKPHSFTDATNCPGAENFKLLNTGAFDYNPYVLPTGDEKVIECIRNSDDPQGITCLTDGMSKSWLSEGHSAGVALSRLGITTPRDVDSVEFASYGTINEYGALPPEFTSRYDQWGRVRGT